MAVGEPDGCTHDARKGSHIRHLDAEEKYHGCPDTAGEALQRRVPSSVQVNFTGNIFDTKSSMENWHSGDPSEPLLSDELLPQCPWRPAVRRLTCWRRRSCSSHPPVCPALHRHEPSGASVAACAAGLAPMVKASQAPAAQWVQGDDCLC